MERAAGPAAEVTISPMSREDVPEVHLIERDAFTSPWSLRTFYDALSRHDDFKAFVARAPEGDAPGKIVGYAALFDVGGEYHLISLAVAPGWRRKGIGRRLLEYVMELADRDGVPRLTLEVRLSNEAAISFYAAQGFTPVAVRKHYYEDNGEDALVMWIDRGKGTGPDRH